MQNISKWRLHSAGSALREDGDIYTDFLGTHPTRHDPRVLQAELFQPRLNTEESKKNTTISALRVCFSSGPGTAPQAKSAACFGRGKQNSIRAGFRVVLFQNNPQEADILLFQQGNIGTSKEKQGPAHLWLWAARKTICREHILPIPACSWEKGRISSLTSGSTDAKPRISPFCWRRLRVRQGIPTGAAGAGSTALTAALWLLCCALLTQIRLWRKIWFHFQGFFFSVQSHLSPPRSAALTPGGIPCPKMLIRGKGDILESCMELSLHFILQSSSDPSSSRSDPTALDGQKLLHSFPDLLTLPQPLLIAA